MEDDGTGGMSATSASAFVLEGKGDKIEMNATAVRKTTKDKMDRATSEQVLDPRTRMILFKMLSRGTLLELNGCVSTGKEANVYHGLDGNQEEVAVKVFKTSILVFKDRDRYVTGEFRFRRGYNRHNPREMVRIWAEKEFRNLARLRAAEILAPAPLELQKHVLVMRFFGEDGWAAPRLKDVQITTEEASKAYFSLVLIMRRMFHIAKLVHGDLSEYNILYYQSKLIIIDVSQSVEHEHPHALDFLRRDCYNVNDYFHRQSIETLRTKALFDFVTSLKIQEGTEVDVLRGIFDEESSLRAGDEDDVGADEHVFLNTPIPRSLQDVDDIEGDAVKVAQGDGEKLLYSKLTGLVDNLKVVDDNDVDDENNENEDEGEDEDEDEDKDKDEDEDERVGDSDQGAAEADDSENGSIDMSDVGDENAPTVGDNEARAQVGIGDKLDRKDWKKRVKEEQRERRKNKVPKKVKKRREALAKRGRKN
eukprot:Plantae.Rhodophyta-Purpureofilum_apyrenoidigerum.ctg3606.p1 GENE.Plantae.Rhodophyta-Purpureofilum_apyrenoidigerum.ctg3606~~Plantae.Rhodophyta-Purpureofilum_apyrenoidigerum.ctg3606.p1  ORF type:complete len:478 (+),score=119.58 Plantae.Rhodophyta-Purpureofilum_apyrenoidigerum.ctg3606:156-1589(+)